jgi:hypothetical protein
MKSLVREKAVRSANLKYLGLFRFRYSLSLEFGRVKNLLDMMAQWAIFKS